MNLQKIYGRTAGGSGCATHLYTVKPKASISRDRLYHGLFEDIKGTIFKQLNDNESSSASESNYAIEIEIDETGNIYVRLYSMHE